MGWFGQETVFHHFQTNIPRGGGFLRMIKLDHVEQTIPSYLPDYGVLLFDFIQFFPKDVAEPERIFNQFFIPDHSQCFHSNSCRQDRKSTRLNSCHLATSSSVISVTH